MKSLKEKRFASSSFTFSFLSSFHFSEPTKKKLATATASLFATMPLFKSLALCALALSAPLAIAGQEELIGKM